jgi:hypothetical protein
MISSRSLRRLILGFLLVINNPIYARAEDPGYQVVDNVLIYFGVIPAAMLLNYPSGDDETIMHGGVPSGLGVYHVMIALFDAKTSQRISTAEISAKTSEFGMARESKTLEPMKIADTITFGNFFKFKGNGAFRVDVAIRIPGRPGAIKARFEYANE